MRPLRIRYILFHPYQNCEIPFSSFHTNSHLPAKAGVQIRIVKSSFHINSHPPAKAGIQIRIVKCSFHINSHLPAKAGIQIRIVKSSFHINIFGGLSHLCMNIPFKAHIGYNIINQINSEKQNNTFQKKAAY